MSRINIEDSLFKDGAFLDLAIAMSSRHAALGAVVEAFIIAQEFYLNEETNRLIPLTEWNRRKAVGLVIECGFAELRGENKDFVYVRGSEKQFAWLLQRQEAGSKGGRPKNDKSPDQIKPQETKPEESGRLSEQTGSNPLTLSLTPPLTLSLTSNSNSSSDKKPKKKLTSEQSEQNKKIWESYFNAYRLRYGIDPVRNAAVNSQVSQLREKIGFETAVDLVKFYLTHNKSFYLLNTHTFGHCLVDAETLRTQWLRGKAITNNEVKNFEKKQNSIETQNAFKEGHNF